MTDQLLFDISLAQWSLHRMLFADELDPLDFARLARDEFGIEAIEYVNTFYKDKATDFVYLEELKQRADDQGVASLVIMVDHEGDLGDPNENRRIEAVENHFRWVDAAKFLGCHSIRVNARSAGIPAVQQQLVADGLRRLTEFADERDLSVLVENHGGLSSNAQWLAGVMTLVDHPNCGTLPDFGNFCLDWEKRDDPAMWYDRYEGVKAMMPWAKAVSAKSNEFDEDGNDTQTDYEKMMRIVLDAGYRGYVGVEYEGEDSDEAEGIRTTKALLERVRETLTPQYA
ncbi:MAG: sugar phosphate isomerase/epimerase [Planctomycetes bacterium]|nr:sugar phosphate isomerase/epimerase [Planctomycetota bacterium]